MAMILENTDELFSQNEVDYYLGPSEKRYFGHNYKKISHIIGELNMTNDCISADVGIVWPNCWAEKKGKKITPHIGTLDYFVIAIRFVELYLLKIDNRNIEELNNMWISHIKCQSNKCIEKNKIICCCSLVSASNRLGLITHEYEVLIDNTKVNLTIEFNENKTFYPYSGSIPFNSIHKSFFFDKYKSYNLLIKNVVLNLDESFVCADIDSDIFNTWENCNGLTQGYMPYFTLCDLVVVAGQLSQILLFNKSGITRDDSYNLWMRQIKCIYNKPIQCCAKLKVSILKSKILRIKCLNYNSVDLHFNFNNGDLITECKAAYQIQ